MRTGAKVTLLPNEWTPLGSGSTVELAGARLTVLEVSGPPLVRSRLPFAFEDIEAERVVEFRRRFHLEEVVSGGRTELERQMLLRDWVAGKMHFGKPTPGEPDPFLILEQAAQGRTHYCTHFALVYLAALVSLGHTARKLSTAGHGTVEVWSNELAKWVVLDPTRRNCYRLQGRFLDAQEIRRQWLTDGGVSMEVLYGLDERTEPVTLERREDGLLKYRQEAFEWTAYHDRNNFLQQQVDFERDRFYICRDEHNRDRVWTTQPSDPGEPHRIDPRYRLATLTHRLQDIYWTVNVTRVHLAPRTARSLTVQLDTMTPNFDTFLLEVGGRQRRSRARFTWRLRRGANTLRVRVRNRMGVAGPAASVTVECSRTRSQ